MIHDGQYHVPVMLNEVIDALQIVSSGVYVDCTFGGGGHSKKILEKLDSKSQLIVFDQDEDARQNMPNDDRVIFVPHNFQHLQRFLRFHKITAVNGILADLGTSSHQINVAERGFSTRFDAALDMRMSRNGIKTAGEVIRSYPKEKLHKIFEQYGEVTNAKTLARLIVDQRQTQRLSTINEFKNAIYPVVKGNPDKYLAQVFQALRIEVNDELNVLKEMLEQSVKVLKNGGRIAVITFHSLEDRIVKNFFKYGNFDEMQKHDLFGNTLVSPLRSITKKPIVPSPGELQSNPRARSSKLRVAEKVVT
ncbi:MAG: 16S rRNA (cytosine(1402)-N(4))-methyltransferase RsmH [Ginsengibacter sp.]